MDRHVLLVIGALAIMVVLIWLKITPKLVAILAFVVGLNIGSGWAGRWLREGVELVAGWVGWAGGMVLGLPAGKVAAVVPAVLGAALILIVGKHMWPKKGKATLLTAGAAFVLPLLWPAVKAGLEIVSPGITSGGGA